ncbi:MAG: thiamine diphosphokinase [Clostridia bacterium]
MRAVIISAGTISDYDYVKSFINEDDYIVCADGGLAHCKNMGLKPDLIVGDFDSFKGTLPEDGAEIVTFPCEKDYTDTHTALLEAVNRGADEFLFIGTSGTRLDHTLSNIGLLETVRRMGFKGKLVDRNNIMYAAEKREIIHGKPGTNISFIPIEPVKGITLRGFKYPLNNADINLYETIWVSNVLEEETGIVTFDSGVLLVDISKD